MCTVAIRALTGDDRYHGMGEHPKRIGPFRVLRSVGRGGIAEVFLAVAHGASGFERKVALKVLLPELQGDGDHERVLVDEARLAAGLRHQNLVSVDDLGVSDGVWWARMEWVDGADLASLLDGGPLPPALALMVAEEIARALAFLHAARDDAGRPLGLVHRDVSPANVMVSRAGEVKLGDFGIAKATVLREVTDVGARKGKWAYMSPEQVAGAPVTDASDRFSLGIVLCELLTGSRPFDDVSPLLTMERIRACEPPTLPGLDDDLRDLAHAALSLDPAGRFGSTRAMYGALSAARARRPRVDAFDLAELVIDRVERR